MKKPIFIKPEHQLHIATYEEMDYYNRRHHNPLPYNHLALDLKGLPENAEVVTTIRTIGHSITDGIVFAGSRDTIAKNFDERVSFWNKADPNEDRPDWNCVFYQNSKFRVGPQESDYEEEQKEETKINPVTYVVSESDVIEVYLNEVALNPENKGKFVEIIISGIFDIWSEEDYSGEEFSFFFKVDDILECPNNHSILFEPFMNQLLDYGYYY